MHIFRAILFGALFGAAIFFIPFHLPFLLLFFPLFFFGRFLFWPWRRQWYGHGYGWRHEDWNYNETIPIDGYGRNAREGNQAPEQKITIQ
jgi:hypothetical protein